MWLSNLQAKKYITVWPHCDHIIKHNSECWLLRLNYFISTHKWLCWDYIQSKMFEFNIFLECCSNCFNNVSDSFFSARQLWQKCTGLDACSTNTQSWFILFAPVYPAVSTLGNDYSPVCFSVVNDKVKVL